MDTEIAPNTGIGGNFPPEPIEILRAQLQETHAPLTARCNELLAMQDRLPETMDDDWEAKITEAIKSCTKFVRNSEVTRLDANEPHRALIAATDGFFKAMSDKVEALKKLMTAKYLTPYQQKKADEEKRRREEEARIAKAKADEEARAAREEARLLAEAKRLEDLAKAEAARLEREATDKVAREAAAIARAAADRLATERAEQERASKEARDAAAVAKQEKDKTATSAKASAADMSRTRTTLGAVGSLRKTWKFEVVDAAAVPRLYLSVNEAAIGAAVRAATTPEGNNPLKIDGVRIYPQTDSVVR